MNKAVLSIAIYLLGSPMAIGQTYKVIDVHGNTVVQPIYEAIQVNGKGAFEVTKPQASRSRGQAKETVVIDFNGNVISPEKIIAKKPEPLLPSGYTSFDERDGFLFVRGPNGNGVFSNSGREIIPAHYMDIRSNGDRMFTARKFEGEGRFLLDDQGKTICELPEWARPDSNRFHEGLLNISGNFGPPKFVDKQGRLKSVEGAYSRIGDFIDGLAVADYTLIDSWYSGFIDKSGRMVLGPFKDSVCEPFVKGIAVIKKVEKPSTLWTAGLITRSGRFAVPIGTYDNISATVENNWLATNHEGCFLLHHDGGVRCTFPKGSKSVSLPPTLPESVLIPVEFEAGRKNRDEAPQMVWGYCNLAGEICIKPTFSYCMPFDGDLAVAGKFLKDGSQLSGVINRSGEWILQPFYASVVIASPDRFIVQNDVTQTEKLLFERDKVAQRHKIFSGILRDHNIIGMSGAELETYLGKPDSETKPDGKEGGPLTYFLTQGACGYGASYFEFYLDKNKNIYAWRLGESMIPQGRYLITEDVVQHGDGPFTLRNLVPKNDP